MCHVDRCGIVLVDEARLEDEEKGCFAARFLGEGVGGVRFAELLAIEIQWGRELLFPFLLRVWSVVGGSGTIV